MRDDDLAKLRAALERRPDACWDRLDDAVSELSALHMVDAELIVARVRATIAAESAEDSAAAVVSPILA